MQGSKLRLTTDLVVAMATIYASVWVYEVANWASFELVGINAGLVVSGVLPVGVGGASAVPGNYVLVKPLQVGLSLAIVGSAFLALKKAGLTATRLALLVSMGFFVASFFWESLSLLTIIPVVAYEIVFFSFVAITLTLLTSRVSV